jgi:hypothetical protein
MCAGSFVNALFGQKIASNLAYHRPATAPNQCA